MNRDHADGDKPARGKNEANLIDDQYPLKAVLGRRTRITTLLVRLQRYDRRRSEDSALAVVGEDGLHEHDQHLAKCIISGRMRKHLRRRCNRSAGIRYPARRRLGGDRATRRFVVVQNPGAFCAPIVA